MDIEIKQAESTAQKFTAQEKNLSLSLKDKK